MLQKLTTSLLAAVLLLGAAAPVLAQNQTKQAQQIRLSISDQLGRILLIDQFEADQVGEQTINISNLLPGHYQLQAANNTGRRIIPFVVR